MVSKWEKHSFSIYKLIKNIKDLHSFSETSSSISQLSPMIDETASVIRQSTVLFSESTVLIKKYDKTLYHLQTDTCL